MTGVGNPELKDDPIIGPLFSAAGVVFLEREGIMDADGAQEALEPAVRALRQGRSIAIAPEGTRSLTPRLGAFKKGAFHLAMEAGVPIVPVVFRNVLDAYPKNARVVRPATIEAIVLPPIDTRDWTREDIPERVDAIRSGYLEILRQD